MKYYIFDAGEENIRKGFIKGVLDNEFIDKDYKKFVSDEKNVEITKRWRSRTVLKIRHFTVNVSYKETYVFTDGYRDNGDPIYDAKVYTTENVDVSLWPEDKRYGMYYDYLGKGNIARVKGWGIDDIGREFKEIKESEVQSEFRASDGNINVDKLLDDNIDDIYLFIKNSNDSILKHAQKIKIHEIKDIEYEYATYIWAEYDVKVSGTKYGFSNRIFPVSSSLSTEKLGPVSKKTKALDKIGLAAYIFSIIAGVALVVCSVLGVFINSEWGLLRIICIGCVVGGVAFFFGMNKLYKDLFKYAENPKERVVIISIMIGASIFITVIGVAMVV